MGQSDVFYSSIIINEVQLANKLLELNNFEIMTRKLALSTKHLIFLQKLKQLDLSAIAYKLMHSEEGWTKQKTTQALLRYMMFLFILNLYPNQNLVPTVEIDRVWHHHILDTQKYAQDCEELFGRFIHHSPYTGLGNDASNWQASFSETQKLFKQYFGVELLAEGTQNQPAQCEPFKTSKIRPNFDRNVKTILSKIEITVITIIMSFIVGVIFGERQTTLPTSTATIAITEAKGKHLFNSTEKCECGKTVNHKYFD